MSNTVIKVENLSKQYRLGHVGTGTMAHDLNRFWHRLRGKEDPYLKIGEENDRSSKGNSQYVWALKGVDFNINHGEVVGIIGRNGAGKSTLLKILSRTTTPTTGKVKIKGRVASLLEVGTGFHPELSGRENIFLNGAILGMTKQEIRSKFDEIVDFSGVERYIDTPVKRYSSGMYVRLAFGVAAHLEPEILIVDEVLAVGDAEFQKKALGKMKDVSNKEGRTVLFVSHNMSAVKALCQSGLIFENGKLILQDNIHNTISHYYSRQLSSTATNYFRDGNKKVEFLNLAVLDDLQNERKNFLMGEDIFIKFSLQFNSNTEDVEVGVNVKNQNHDLIFHICNYDDDFHISGQSDNIKNFLVKIPAVMLTPGSYILDIGAVIGGEKLDILEGFAEISLSQGPIIKRRSPYPSHTHYYSPSDWKILENAF
jgi:lipopolysaccharide transport system ATP-binding protein